MKNSGQQTHIIKHSASRFYNLLFLFTQTRKKNKKILYESICMNKDYPGRRGSSGEPIIQGAEN